MMPAYTLLGRVTKPCGDCMEVKGDYHHCTMNCSGAPFLLPSVDTHFIYPPIPLRQFDWCAMYSGDEPDDEGNVQAGYGKTPRAAIEDLFANFPKE